MRIPERNIIDRAAQLLNSKNKIAILIGVGAKGAGTEVEQLAEILAAPIIKSLLAKDIVPDVDACSVGFDGKKVWMTPRAHRALTHQYNTI